MNKDYITAVVLSSWQNIQTCPLWPESLYHIWNRLLFFKKYLLLSLISLHLPAMKFPQTWCPCSPKCFWLQLWFPTYSWKLPYFIQDANFLHCLHELPKLVSSQHQTGYHRWCLPLHKWHSNITCLTDFKLLLHQQLPNCPYPICPHKELLFKIPHDISNYWKFTPFSAMSTLGCTATQT